MVIVALFLDGGGGGICRVQGSEGFGHGAVQEGLDLGDARSSGQGLDKADAEASPEVRAPPWMQGLGIRVRV